MLKFILSSVLLLISSMTVEKTKGPMDPLQSEKLTSPIYFSDKCKKISIVEWKNHKPSIESLDKLCNKSVRKFFTFTGVKNNTLPTAEISLLPINSNYRSLNDSDYRFFYRTKSYSDGKVVPIWGYFQRSNLHLYLFDELVKNGKLNIQFEKTFVHELFHALSWQFGLFSKRGKDADKKEEIQADKFATHVLGN